MKPEIEERASTQQAIRFPSASGRDEGVGWYLVQTHSNNEKKVKTLIEETAKIADLGDDIKEILVPTQGVLEMRNGQKKLIERKVFPGYVLIKMRMNDVTWNLIRNTPKVLRFVGGTNKRPEQVPENELSGILNKLADEVSSPKFKITYEIGEVVRVVDGPFNEFDAVVEEINYLKNRLSVMVQIFGRATPVELDLNQVEKT